MDDDNDDKNARTNVSLKKVAPELESEYAQYPMKRYVIVFGTAFVLWS